MLHAPHRPRASLPCALPNGAESPSPHRAARAPAVGAVPRRKGGSASTATNMQMKRTGEATRELAAS
eukprot:2160277-Pleurochrysis_carterae.AAC.2